MLKTQQLFQEIKTLQYKIKEQVTTTDSFYINAGSYWHKQYKYVTDIDFLLALKSDNISNQIVDIYSIYSLLKTNPNIKKIDLFIGCHDYFYGSNFKLKDITKLYNDKVLSQANYDRISNLFKINSTQYVIREALGHSLKIKWSLDDIKNGFTNYKNTKYILKDLIYKADNFADSQTPVKFNIYYNHNNNLIGIDFIIQTYKNWVNQRKSGRSWNGCEIPQIQYKSGLYYKSLKRLRSCYGRMIKRREYNSLSNKDKKYLFDAYNQLDNIIIDNFKFLAEHQKKKTKAKFDNDSIEYKKLSAIIRNYFQPMAKKFFNQGKKHNLIY